ncbi:E3 ubiquitin-protein ligase lubel isoform X3 [Lates calcarifer]|uniref:E3 ubiquitin-protein ligase lubel isoform X3 n=1 Tax=Lates calcarifer TaxID=8187 RepID=A0AAJ7PPB0_LATCA|nr:E3 ubiquitin-protein ligase lubel isoform X3 [Lates calcarifer]
MPRVGAKEELRTLVECQYSYPAETLSDLHKVRALFSDLRLYVDFYCFPNKEKKRLVYLAGTIPVHYEGSEYNIPVCIWLHETHPVSRPCCYVCPSISMAINPSCPCVDTSGNISLDGLRNWTHGVSNLSLLVSEMRQAFQVDTPLYARCPAQAPPPTGVQVSPSATEGRSESHHHISSISSSPQSSRLPLTSSYLSGQKASQWEASREVRVRRSYTEELLGIDFSAPPPSSSSSSSSSSNHYNPFLSSSSPGPPPKPLSRMMGALSLDGGASGDQQDDSPVQIVQSEAARDRHRLGSGPAPELHQDQGTRFQSEPAAGADHIKMAARLSPDRAAIFFSLMKMKGRSFSPSDVMEAVQLNKDLPSALRFLTHSCPICQDQVTFSKIITMTHCSCFLCQTCFKTFFSAAIKERSIDQLVCPQCGRPEVRGQGRMEESMDYFNLLDTQIRHFLPAQLHELFQRKLRDRALQEMPNFCWCAHCSFGMLHEADRLRMDCPSCKKSTCSQCRSPWSPQHQGLSCEQFRVWQQQNHPDHSTALLSYNSIECPNCQFIFILSKGGCLHFTCSQCQYQFCGGCSQTFTLGAVSLWSASTGLYYQGLLSGSTVSFCGRVLLSASIVRVYCQGLLSTTLSVEVCGFSADCGTKGLHAHHPRDCLYHLRDWSVTRLHLLLQFYRVSPSWLEPAKGSSPDTSGTGVCLVLELRDDGSRREEPCGQPALPEYRGYCQLHYKERLVELINRCRADPAVLFSPAEMMVELQRWHIAVPTRKPDESEQLYAQRLRLTLTNRVPLRKQRRSPLKLNDDLCPLTSAVAAGAPPPHLLLTD